MSSLGSSSCRFAEFAPEGICWDKVLGLQVFWGLGFRGFLFRQGSGTVLRASGSIGFAMFWVWGFGVQRVYAFGMDLSCRSFARRVGVQDCCMARAVG